MTPPPTTGCVVFDLDDTLFLERDYVRSGFRAVGALVEREMGVGGFFDEAWAAFERGDRGRIFDTALAAVGVEPRPRLVAELVEAYRAHPPEIGLLPDAADCLARLRPGVVLAVVTDGPAASQRAKATAMGAADWAAVVVVTAELGPGRGKPHPEGFLAVEEATGFAGRHCIYVADNPHKDFEGPAGLGWRTARVRRVGSLHEQVASGPLVESEAPDLAWLGTDAPHRDTHGALDGG